MGQVTFRACIESLKKRKVAVVGASLGNMSLIEQLLAAGVDVTVFDARTAEQMGDESGRLARMGAGLYLGERYLDALNAPLPPDNRHADVIFRAPELMPSNPALQTAAVRGAVLMSEIELFFEVCPCKIIGVTGSDGKTTTATIIAELLKNQGMTVHFGGDAGRSLVVDADTMKAGDIAVVELSSFQLITMKRSPHIAVVTNVNSSYPDLHSDINEYIDAKRNIARHQKPGDRIVLNFDNDQTRRFTWTAKTEDQLFFSMKEKVQNGICLERDALAENFQAEGQAPGFGEKKTDVPSVIVDTQSGELCSPADIALPGEHNVENYMAAFAAVRGLVNATVMRKTARSFKGVQHRLEFVRELRGVRYFNDAVASSPTRTVAALRSFKGKVVLIAGGKDECVRYDELGAWISKRARKLVLMGAAAKNIKDAVIFAPDYNEEKLEIKECEGFTEAVMEAIGQTEPGDIVLLSPAGTSSDQFNSFEERGNRFKEIIYAIK